MGVIFIRKLVLAFLVFISFGLVSCGANTKDYYTDDSPITIAMANDSLKILQLTDMHLTYGIDSSDRNTFSEIKTLVGSDDYDLIAITGDMTLSPFGPSLFAKLVRFMESLKTPWTFIFGNHESDYNDYTSYLDKINNTEYLYFKVGPEMVGGGYGNFQINFTKDGLPFYSAYFLDSHAERKYYTEDEGMYDYLKMSQVSWYESHVSQDTTDSVMFMHIPLRQFMDVDRNNMTGTFGEDKVYPQGVDTGMFSAILSAGMTKGVFVGHDHLNDYSFVDQGVLLAYGQITGYSGYGNLPRGGRVIDVSNSGDMTSHILLESDVVS